MKRTSRLVVLSAIAALMLSGCGSGPARGGAAAIIGDERITTEDLGQRVEAGAADPASAAAAADAPGFQRNLLRALITTRLAEEVARRNGVSLSQVQAQQAVAAANTPAAGGPAPTAELVAQGLSQDVIEDSVRADALRAAVGDRLTADVPVVPADLQQTYRALIDRYDSVTLALGVQPDLAAAQAQLPAARALSDADFGALVGPGNGEGAPPGGVFPPFSRSDLGVEPGLAEQAFSATPGETFAVASVGGNGAFLVRVIARRTTSLEQATPELRRALLQPQIEAALREQEDRIEVQVNPRFGSWDPAQRLVLSPDETPGRKLSVPAVPSTAPAPEVPPGDLPPVGEAPPGQ